MTTSFLGSQPVYEYWPSFFCYFFRPSPNETFHTWRESTDGLEALGTSLLRHGVYPVYRYPPRTWLSTKRRTLQTMDRAEEVTCFLSRSRNFFGRYGVVQVVGFSPAPVLSRPVLLFVDFGSVYIPTCDVYAFPCTRAALRGWENMWIRCHRCVASGRSQRGRQSPLLKTGARF